MTKQIKRSWQKGAWIPGATAMLAILTCKGIVVVAALFPLVSFVSQVNPHMQAAVISLFCVLTFVFVLINHRRCHHFIGPVVACSFGVVMVIGTMYLAYSPMIETAGLMVLMVSALWSWKLSKQRLLADTKQMVTV